MPTDWDRFVEDHPYLKRAPFDEEDQGEPYFFGSSLDFDDWLRENEPRSLIPERDVVPLDGAVGWTPGHESPDSEICAVCLTEHTIQNAGNASLRLHKVRPVGFDASGRPVPSNRTDTGEFCPVCRGIDRGSLLFCPKCNGSGFDHRAHRQRQLAGLPPAEPASKPARSKPADRAETSSGRETAEPSLTRRLKRAMRYGHRDGPDQPADEEQG